MPDFHSIRLTPGRVSTLTINRPQAYNALNSQVLEELDEAIERLGHPETESDRTRCLMVMGEGSKAFVAGADLAAMKGMPGADARALSALGQKAMGRLARFFAPTVAVVQGFALGGGFELALACDFIVASEEAVFALPEVSLGLVPGFGGTHRLSRRVGRNAALKIALLGERMTAKQALDLGVVSEVVARTELQGRAEAIGQQLAKMSPEAVYACKRLVADSPSLSVEAAEASERGAFAALMETAAAQDAIERFLKR